MIAALRPLVLALALALAAVTSNAAPASAQDVVVTLTVTPTSVLEGNAVTATATVKTTSGAPVTNGSIEFEQGGVGCGGPRVPLNSSGKATGVVPMPAASPYADVVAWYVAPDGTSPGESATARVTVRHVHLPTAVKNVYASDLGGGDVHLGAAIGGLWHWACADDDNGIQGEIAYYEGRQLLGSSLAGHYFEGDLYTRLSPGLHQLRMIFTPNEHGIGWTGSASTFNVNIAGSGTSVTPELVSNPSFEATTTGWTSVNGTVTRLARSGAPHGSAVAKATRSTGTTYSLTDTGTGLTPTVRSTTAGATYIGGANVAAATSASVGKPVTLVLRERTAAGSLVKEWKAKTTLSTSFKRLAVTAKTSATGNTIGIRVEQSSAATGHAFYADAMAVRHAGQVEGNAGYSLTDHDTGTVWTALTANAKRATKKPVTQLLDITKLSAYLDGKGAASGSQVLKGVIYADANGTPGNIVATTAAVTVKAGAAEKYVDLNFAAPVRLAAGNYWFALHSGGTGGVARYLAQTVPGALRTNADGYSDGATKTFGTATSDGKAIVMHATGG